MIQKQGAVPTLKQYLTVCKAGRRIKEEINETDQNYNPVKVRILMKKVKEINDKIAKQQLSAYFDKNFQDLQSTLKTFEQEKKKAAINKTEIYSRLQKNKLTNPIMAKAENQILESIQALREMKSRPLKSPKKQNTTVTEEPRSQSRTKIKRERAIKNSQVSEIRSQQKYSLLAAKKKREVSHDRQSKDSMYFSKYYALKQKGIAKS